MFLKFKLTNFQEHPCIYTLQVNFTRFLTDLFSVFWLNKYARSTTLYRAVQSGSRLLTVAMEILCCHTAQTGFDRYYVLLCLWDVYPEFFRSLKLSHMWDKTTAACKWTYANLFSSTCWGLGSIIFQGKKADPSYIGNMRFC